MIYLEYKGYQAQSDFNEKAACYEGKVINIGDFIHFCGLTPNETRSSFQYCIDLYLEVCEKHGMPPKRPQAKPSFN